MQNTQDILFNITGQSLTFEPPEGRPSSVTSVTVFENKDGDDGPQETATTGSGSVDSASTTLTASAGPAQTNPKRMTVSAVTNFAVGGRYWLTNVDGEKEAVEATGINASSLYIDARHPLRNAYASSATLQAAKISISVDSTFVAASNNISDWIDPNPRYRVRWVYVVGGVTYVHASYFDLVRYKGDYTVSGADVDARFPGWLDALGTNDQEDQGRRVIAEAYRQVKIDLYQQLKADQMIRNAEAMDELVILRAALNRAETQAAVGGSATDGMVLLDKLYTARLTTLISHTKIPFAADQGGGARQTTPTNLWRR